MSKPTKILAKRSLLNILLLCSVLALGGVRSCCNTSTQAVLVGEGRAYKWLPRNLTSGLPLQRDDASLIDELVYTLQPPYQEYSYKLGLEASTNCNISAGYSTWRASGQRLQLDLSSYASNTALKICLLARGFNDCGELITQTVQNASSYHWIKSAPLGNFSITGPAALLRDTAPRVTWQPSEFATSYKVDVSSNAACTSPVQSTEVINNTFLDLSALSDGKYFVCLNSKEANLGTHAALNNPWNFEVDTTPPGEWDFTVPSVNNNPNNIGVYWRSSSEAHHYKLSVSADPNCGSVIYTWDNLTSNFLNVSVPNYGVYYLCGEAHDEAGNIAFATNTGAQFTVNYIETLTLLDNIGSDPLISDKNISVGNHINQEENIWYQIVLFNLPVIAPTRLTTFIAHMEGSRPSALGYICGPNSSVFNTRLNIWTSLELARNNAQNGDFKSILIAPEALIDRAPTGGISLTGCPIERLEFDLSHADILLEPGTNYYFSLAFEGAAGSEGIWGILESGMSGVSDWIIYDDFLHNKRQDQVTTFAGSQSGKFAVKVVGVPE